MSADKRKAIADGYRSTSIYASTRQEIGVKRDKAIAENPDKKYRTIQYSSGFMLYEKYKPVKDKDQIERIKDALNMREQQIIGVTASIAEINAKLENLRLELATASKNEHEYKVAASKLKYLLKDSGVQLESNEKINQ
jgi:hypothetical protein